MPTKTTEEHPTMYIMNPDGTSTRIGEISQVEFTSDSSDDFETSRIVQEMNEYTFTVTWSPTAKTVYLLIHGRFPSNNWLRMHGYGAERRRAKGRKRMR